MISEPRLLEGWTEVERPPSLYRRFEFPAYAETRAFLDRLAALSKDTGLYPDLSFSRTYVNVTVHGSDAAVGAEERTFAAQVQTIVPLEVA